MHACSATAKLVLGVGFALALLAPRSAFAGRPAFVYVNANPNQGANSLVGVRVSSTGQPAPLPGSPYSTGGLG